jgi:WD40 repeat protein
MNTRHISITLLLVQTWSFAAPPKAQLVPWTASVDPLKEKLQYAKDVRVTLPAENVGMSFIAADVDRNGRYLAVGLMTGGPTQSWTLVDLTSGKSEPSLSEKMWLDKDCLLSPDGTYLAGGGVDLPSGESFQVWSVKEKKRVVNLKLTAGVGTPDFPLTFLDSAHLLVHNNDLKHDGLQLLDIPAGKITRTITLNERLSLSKIFVISPGGRYFAATTDFGVAGQGLFIVDIDAGKTVGQSLVPEFGHFRRAGNVRGMAFSRDGKEIAALFEGSKNVLLIWDASTGKVVANFNVRYDTGHNDDTFGRYVEFQPDGKRLRISHFLIDRATGETVETIPSPPGDKGPMPLVMLLADDAALTSSLPDINRKQVRLVSVKIGR